MLDPEILSFLLLIVWFLTVNAFLPICFWNRHLRYRTRFEISTKSSTFYKMARKSNWYVRSNFSHHNHKRIVLLRFIITECCTLLDKGSRKRARSHDKIFVVISNPALDCLLSPLEPSNFNPWAVWFQPLNRPLSSFRPSTSTPWTVRFSINHSILETAYFPKDCPLLVKRPSTLTRDRPLSTVHFRRSSVNCSHGSLFVLCELFARFAHIELFAQFGLFAQFAVCTISLVSTVRCSLCSVRTVRWTL